MRVNTSSKTLSNSADKDDVTKIKHEVKSDKYTFFIIVLSLQFYTTNLFITDDKFNISLLNLI